MHIGTSGAARACAAPWVLAGDEPLVGRRQLDEAPVVGQPEVGAEAADGRARRASHSQCELHRLVFPPLARTSRGGRRRDAPRDGRTEPGRRARRPDGECAASAAHGSVALTPQRPARRDSCRAALRRTHRDCAEGSSRTMSASSSSTTPASGTMLNTPCPPARRSTTSPLERASTELVPVSTRLAMPGHRPRSSRRHSTARRADWNETPASSSCLITLSSRTSEYE